MVCPLSHSTTKGLSISALVLSVLTLVLGIVSVIARKGMKGPKGMAGLAGLMVLATFALILASGFAVYGRSIAGCQKKRDRKAKQDMSVLRGSHSHSNHDDDSSSRSEFSETSHLIMVGVAVALFLILGIVICSRSTEGCLLFGLFTLLS